MLIWLIVKLLIENCIIYEPKLCDTFKVKESSYFSKCYRYQTLKKKHVSDKSRKLSTTYLYFINTCIGIIVYNIIFKMVPILNSKIWVKDYTWKKILCPVKRLSHPNVLSKYYKYTIVNFTFTIILLRYF